MSQSKPSYTCEAAPSPLRQISDHAYQLYLLLGEGQMMPADPVGDWLIMSAGLSNVAIHTNGLDEQDAYCSNIYEEERGRAASQVATELTRLLFVWGAVELLMKRAIAPRGRRDESDPKRMSRLVDAAPSLLHNDCAARNLLAQLANHPDADLAEVHRKATSFDAGVIGQGTQAAYGVRNALAHGAVSWPDGSDAGIPHGVAVARLSCRVLLFAAQNLLRAVTPPTAYIVVFEDSEDGEDSVAKELRTLDLIRSAHLLHTA